MTTNKMNPKKKYAKPTVKLAKWELNEAICQTVSCNSYTKCFDIKTNSHVIGVETRNNSQGEWSRVGSTSSNSW